MITVAGSINMDLVVRAARFPKQGETVLGNLYTTAPGGKGANQAVAAARLGSEVRMIGAVGTDAFGNELLSGLKAEAVNTERVRRAEGTSGIANILLSEGDNRIIVVPGANHALQPEEMEQHEAELAASSLVLMQLELPVPVIRRVLEICRRHGVPTILNPAPAEGFASELLPYITYLTPNETEAEELFGAKWEEALKQYPNRLVVTLGEKGAVFWDGERIIKVPGHQTSAVDTTGAGDAFTGALAVAISEGMTFGEAVHFANAAASLTVEKMGAQNGMPGRTETHRRLNLGQIG